MVLSLAECQSPGELPWTKESPAQQNQNAVLEVKPWAFFKFLNSLLRTMQFGLSEGIEGRAFYLGQEQEGKGERYGLRGWSPLVQGSGQRCQGREAQVSVEGSRKGRCQRQMPPVGNYTWCWPASWKWERLLFLLPLPSLPLPAWVGKSSNLLPVSYSWSFRALTVEGNALVHLLTAHIYNTFLCVTFSVMSQ